MYKAQNLHERGLNEQAYARQSVNTTFTLGFKLRVGIKPQSNRIQPNHNTKRMDSIPTAQQYEIDFDSHLILMSLLRIHFLF